MTRSLLLGSPGSPSVAAGCGSAESSEPVATTEVAMAKSYRFEPKVIEVDAGETVTWTNDDNFTHTVRVDGQDDHKVDRGDSVSITFDEARHLSLRLHPAPAGHGRRGDRPVIGPLERDLVIVACAISAGIHAALAPATSARARPPACGFLAAAALLAAARRRADAPAAGSASLLGGRRGRARRADRAATRSRSRPACRSCIPSPSPSRRSRSSRRPSRRPACSPRPPLLVPSSPSTQRSSRMKTGTHIPSDPACADGADRVLQRPRRPRGLRTGTAPMRTTRAPSERGVAPRSSRSETTCGRSGRITSPGPAWP